LPDFCFAAQHKDASVLVESSSGGAFSAISQCFESDSYLFGALFDEDLNVVFRGETGKERHRYFYKSKYVQADLGLCFQKVKRLLDDNLFCIEILCHGVASPRVFRDYISYLGGYYGQSIDGFTFRFKKDGKASWKDFCTKIDLSDGKKILHCDDKYMKGYLAGLFLRNSCLSCVFAQSKRFGDVIIGDYWGIDESLFEFPDLGISLIIPLTQEGNRVCDSLAKKMIVYRLPIDSAIPGNKILVRSNEASPFIIS
jgi:hypothetical protein